MEKQMEICENCYEEVSKVFKVKGMECCKSCVTDLKNEANGASMYNDEDALLDQTDYIPGVMSDDDVVNMFREEYLDY
jgi:hypothetical protein